VATGTGIELLPSPNFTVIF